jgi:hypothetical protein
MEDWGLEWEQWFREFLELPNGIPNKDTFRKFFEQIQPEELLICLNPVAFRGGREGQRGSEHRREDATGEREGGQS